MRAAKLLFLDLAFVVIAQLQIVQFPIHRAKHSMSGELEIEAGFILLSKFSNALSSSFISIPISHQKSHKDN